MLKIGWILLVIGIFLGIFGTLFLTESEAGLAILESLVCGDNESLVRLNTTNADGERSFTVHCRKNDGGELIDVNVKLIPVLGIVFLPLILSLPMLWLGSRRRAQNNTDGVKHG